MRKVFSLGVIIIWCVGCPTESEISENDLRFTPCDEVASCSEDTVCVYGLCQPLVLCDSDADCARNIPNVCADCTSVGQCNDLHGDERECIAPRICVSIDDGSTKACDQAGVGCEEEGTDYYCSRLEERTCLRAQDTDNGSDPIFYCGPNN